MSAASKQLNLFDATMLVMGGIIGVGIFFKPHGVAQIVPEPVPYFCVWALGALAALAGAMTFAELAGTFPRTGGWYVFLREGLGGFPAFLFAWIVLLVISTGACAAVADFGAERIQNLAGLDTQSVFQRRAIAAVLILAITGVAWTGIKSSTVVQNLCMVAKLTAIGTLVVAGLLFFSDIPLQSVPTTPPTSPLAGRMITATLPVLFTFGGWQLVTYIAPHVRDPQRTLPRAIVLGVAGVGVIYLALNAAFVRVLGMGALADMQDVAAPLASRALGPRGAIFLELAMAVSAMGFLVATILATPGIYVAMAREGLFLEAVGRTNSATGAPRVALSIQAAICLCYLALSSNVRDDLADAVVFGEWIFHCLVGLALLRLRHVRPELPRPFRSFLYPLFPVLYTGLAAAVVVGNLWLSPWYVTRIGVLVLVMGGVVYLPWRRIAGAGR